jgi:hypothetical protein
MIRRATLVALAATTLLLAAGQARADDLDDDFQVWAPAILQLDIGPKVLRGWFEVQPRFDEDAGQLGVLLTRPALGVYVRPWLTAWAGYAYVERLRPEYAHEHRAWEQLQANATVDEESGTKVMARLRVEHRLREGEDPVAHRVRLLVRAQRALADLKPMSLHGIVWNEVFVGLNTVKWGPASGFDRNRSFIGLGLQMIPEARFEVGYMFEVAHRRGDADELGAHALFVSLWIDLAFE